MSECYTRSVASPTIGFRFTPRQRERLRRAARMLDVSQAQAVHEAITHLVATLELRQAVHRTIPSERAELEGDGLHRDDRPG